jgi:hypothetical protein
MALNLEKVIPTSILDVNANVSMVASAPGGSLGLDSPQVLRVDQATDFTFNWSIGGLFSMFFTGASVKFDAFYELMGPGEAVIGVPTTTLPVTLGTLTTTLTLGANTVPAGVYRIVVRMMVMPPAGSGTIPTVICGFEELGLIEYYDL